MAAAGAEPKPWEQMPGESGRAYAAFLTYRDLGPRRSLVGAARYRWRERAWRWDVQQARQDEAVVRQQREGVLRERLEDLDRLSRASLAFFRTMVRRDPETGEVSFDARFTPQVALRFLELALKAQGAFERPAAEDKPDVRPPADLFGLADAEVMELIDLARERADQQHHTKENGNDSDQDSTQQEQHDEQEDEQDEAERH